ncbi:4'-phosphopantetheinyl transferase family protein [Streptomyces sp. NPDC057011]|uniref:4'-phosphopantetheinyl transferase family protein n=1 Tax=unclassified Streptomyces TaxID=2593676 RepID=UPI0036351529
MAEVAGVGHGHGYGFGSGVGAAFELLDAEERRRARARRSAADRAVYVAAHAALRLLLGAYLAADPAGITFVREDCPGCGGPHGRPALPGAPVHFSLSHTRGLALLAFADSPVGADVEEVPSGDRLPEVPAALHPRERAELAALAPGPRAAAFARCWTRKEALLKGTGRGIDARLMAATRVGVGPAPVAQPGWRLTDLRVPAGYAAACAVRTGPTGPPAS